MQLYLHAGIKRIKEAAAKYKTILRQPLFP